MQLLADQFAKRGGIAFVERQVFSRTAWHAVPVHDVPERPLVILGQAPLMGAISGYLAVELGVGSTIRGSKLWTLYDDEQPSSPWAPRLSNATNRMTYARLCVDAPIRPDPQDDLTYWVDPDDELTQSAGLGCEWLLPVPMERCNGLLPTRLNTLMFDSETILALTPTNSSFL